MNFWSVEHFVTIFCHHFWVDLLLLCCWTNPKMMTKMTKKCSTDQRSIWKRNTTYKIHTLAQKMTIRDLIHRKEESKFSILWVNMILPSQKALEVNQFQTYQFLSTSKGTDINIKMHFSANETLTTFLLRDIQQPSFFFGPNHLSLEA